MGWLILTLVLLGAVIFRRLDGGSEAIRAHVGLSFALSPVLVTILCAAAGKVSSAGSVWVGALVLAAVWVASEPKRTGWGAKSHAESGWLRQWVFGPLALAYAVLVILISADALPIIASRI